MKKDQFVNIVVPILNKDPLLRVQASHRAKLMALGRKVEAGAIPPVDTIPLIEAMYSPVSFERPMRQELERALKD